MGCHALLQETILTQGLNLGLLHALCGRVDSSPLCYLGKLQAIILRLKKSRSKPYPRLSASACSQQNRNNSGLLTEWGCQRLTKNLTGNLSFKINTVPFLLKNYSVGQVSLCLSSQESLVLPLSQLHLFLQWGAWAAHSARLASASPSVKWSHSPHCTAST